MSFASIWYTLKGGSKQKIIILEYHVRYNKISLLCGFESLKGVVCLLRFPLALLGLMQRNWASYRDCLAEEITCFFLFWNTILVPSWEVNFMTGWVCSHCWAGVLALSDADGLLECCVVWWQAQSSLLPSWRCFPVSQLDLEVIEWGGGSYYSKEWNVKHFLLPQASALQGMENQPLSSNTSFTTL